MRKSINYVCTLDPLSMADQEILANLRKTVKVINKTSMQKFRVKVHGRLGKNNPNRHLVTKGQMAFGSIPMDLAQRYDIYIYEVNNRRYA